jgi:uncharacterized protein involved in exopolysaccharide biosynthesis
MATNRSPDGISAEFDGFVRFSGLAVNLLKSRWRLFAVIFMVVGSMPIAYAFLATPVYESQVVLAPSRQSEYSSGLGALVAQLGDLSGFGNLAASGGAEDYNAMAILRSRAFSERIIEDLGLMAEMFPNAAPPVDGQVPARILSDMPTKQDAWLRFNRSVRVITQDQRSGLVTVSIRLPDRQKATETANEIAARINDEVRRRVLHEAATSRQFLERQLEGTDSVELRSAIFRLIEHQIRRQVIANSRPEIAFVLIDPAAVSDVDRVHSPRRGLLIATGIVLGTVLACMGVLLAQLIRPTRQPSK